LLDILERLLGLCVAGVWVAGVGVADDPDAGQYFTGLVHLEGYAILLGQHLLYGLLMASQKENVDLDALRMLTREFTVETFNSFEFMADLGLESMQELGSAHVQAPAERALCGRQPADVDGREVVARPNYEREGHHAVLRACCRCGLRS
jgi:hypothetical protein